MPSTREGKLFVMNFKQISKDYRLVTYNDGGNAYGGTE